MEATALSVGKAVLGGALGYAKSFVADEIALQLGVEKDVVFITDELEMMLAFLMAADEEQDKHKVLLTWVKQVRESAYNVEDNLMDFSAHSDRRPSCWWCVPRALWERRDIAKEVKELRTRVEDVSNRNLRYRLIKGSASKPTTTAEEQAKVASVVAMFGVNEGGRAAAEQENPKVDLCQLITNDDTDLRIISVWGSSGDLGKTSLIREAYEHQMVYKKFGCRAWVMLTSPFNPSEFFNSLLRQFNVYSREVAGKTLLQGKVSGYDVLRELGKMEESHVADQVSVCLEEKRYLIVIDGLTNIVEWDWIKTYLPDKKNGSRIIVSTQQVEVASLCPEQPYQVTELKQLSSDQSIYLFHNKVAPRSVNDSAMPSSSSGAHEETQQLMAVGGDESLERRKLSRSKTMVTFAENFVGRMNEKDDIIKLIGQADNTSRHSSKSKVISVWGMGGLGKTTLVRSVYQSQRLGGWKRAWVTALRPFNSEAILRNLILQLQKDIQQDPAAAGRRKQEKKAITGMGYQELIAELAHLVTQECLIVVDDLSSIEEWDSIKESLAKAGRLIVTTRERIVATYCSSEAIYSLQRLDDTAAFDLFQKKVFKDNSEKVDLHPDMVEQARLILKKCDGLPLAISTISGLLATKPKTTTEWRKINERISAELEMNPELRTIKTVLVRSYDGLPYHLKACFLYLSIFPEDHKIRRKPLIRRWVVEGYAREMPGMTAEEVGDKYFEDLMDRSMILPGEEVNIYSGKIGSCQLHDIMRQICISKAREENLSFTLEGECGLSSSNMQGAVRHLAISSSWTRDKDVFDRTLDLSHVRSLTVFGKWISFFISKNMRFLRVLDLEGTAGITDHHLNQSGELIHLKYISLRGCRGFENLPNSWGSLRNLQTLDLRGTSVGILQSNITNLRKLQFLRAYVLIPRGIGKLNALCTLASVRVLHAKGEHTLKELSQLYQLRKLGIESITGTNNKEFWSAIASLNHLLSLSVNWDSDGSLELDSSLGGSLLPPRSIESLKLGSRVVRLTEWIHHLQNLSRLHLWYTELQQDAIEAVGKLPHLVVLVMRFFSFKGEELVFKQLASFPSLVLLDLDRIGDVLAFVKFEDGTKPKLELLRIYGWKELQELSGLRNLANLKEIRLKGFGRCEQFKDNVQEQLQAAVAGNPNSNVRILREG